MSNSKLNAADFTESYYAETEDGTYLIHVRPGTDLDSTFTCLEEDSGEFMRVSGWMASYRPAKHQPRANNGKTQPVSIRDMLKENRDK